MSINKIIKILTISNFLSSHGGSRSIMEDLVERLTTNERLFITTSTVKHRTLKGIDIVLSLLRNINTIDFAIIDVFSGKAFLWAEIPSIILGLFKKKYVLVLRGGSLPVFQKSNQNRIQRIFSKAEKIITPSEYIIETFSKYKIPIQYLPNPISIGNYIPKKISLPSPKIIWVRAFHEEIYNPILAVKTIEKLRNVKEIKLLMIGPDKGDGSFQKVNQKIIDYELEDIIQIIPGVSKQEIPNYLSKYDIFINTTNVESFGQSVLEAAACGLCIVTTNVGELPYLWEHEVDALLVPPGDAEAMAASIHRILDDPELAARLSTNARKKAEQFDWSIILPQWEALFEDVHQNNS